MNPGVGHFRRVWAGRRLPGAARSIRWLTAAALIALAAPVEAQPAGGATYGPVQRAETLSQLAVRFRGEARVNTRQVMIAILRANPRAFGDGNINALRSGVTLRVPTVAEMEAITPGEAAAEVARHAEAWRNRRRTGSAAPGGAPQPQPPSRPASPPAEEAAAEEGEGEVPDELREARETVADLRERLAERDEAIEDLLIQLASVQRELRRLQAEVEPAPSGGSGAPEGEASGGDAAPSAASWLPVSPLVLGSSLIVLLVLVVVVTLLRQRGETEEALAEEEPFEEEEEGEAGEGPEDETPDGEPPAPEGEAGPEDGRSARDAPAGDGPGAGRRAPASSRTAAGAAAAVASAAGEAEEVREEFPEGEADDLPIGIDLDEEEPWEESLDGPALDEPGPRRRGGPLGAGRHVEVGDLDSLDDGEAGPAAGPPREVSIDPGEGDDPPDDAPAPGQGERGPRE